jgi:hypothetical protein
MLDVSATHPFTACTAFAMTWLKRLAVYDLAGAEALIDVNGSGIPFADSFPRPEGFTYCDPDQMKDWTMHVVAADQTGFAFEFEIPFAEKHYRPMMARFVVRHCGNSLEVRFEAVVPS